MGFGTLLPEIHISDLVMGGKDHEVLGYNLTLKQNEEVAQYLHGGYEMFTPSLTVPSAKPKTTYPITAPYSDHLFPVVSVFENCALILAGKRVGFGVNSNAWVDKTVPYHIEQLLVSSILWVSHGSSNGECNDRVAAPISFAVTVSPADSSARTATFSWEPASSLI